MNAWGRVQRVDGPTLLTVSLSLYHPDAGRRVLVLDGNRIAFHRERPRGLAADGFVRRLRKLLVGAHVQRIERVGKTPRIVLQAGGVDLALQPEAGRPVLRRCSDGHPMAARRRIATRPLDAGSPLTPEDVPSVEPTEPREDGERQDLRRRLRAVRKRVARKLAAIRADGARAEGAPALRHEAELITAHLSRYDHGSASLEVVDWNEDPPAPRVVAIDPTKGAAETAQALFHRAKRFERGARLASERATAVAEILARIDAAIVSFDEQPAEALREMLSAIGERSTRGGTRKKRVERRPFRRFLAHGDAPVLVGRGARDNDAVTLGAKSHHHWLHARGAKGAHVIVPLDKGRTIGPELLADAAMLAAHFSQRRKDDVVEVQHTPRRHVRKPKGSAPGAVRVDREKVIAVRMDPDRLRWLLARER